MRVKRAWVASRRRARKTEELETVLVKLSNDPEMKSIQEEHEREKTEVTTKSMMLQEELRSAWVKKR